MTTTKSTTSREAQIAADPDIPVITITREFDAPADRVFRAWEDPELVRLWMGPRSVDMDITTWDCRTGGSYRYAAYRDGEETRALVEHQLVLHPGASLVLWNRLRAGLNMPLAVYQTGAPVLAASFCPEDGFASPLLTGASLAEAVRRARARILTGSPVTSIDTM